MAAWIRDSRRAPDFISLKQVVMIVAGFGAFILVLLLISEWEGDDRYRELAAIEHRLPLSQDLQRAVGGVSFIRPYQEHKLFRRRSRYVWKRWTDGELRWGRIVVSLGSRDLNGLAVLEYKFSSKDDDMFFISIEPWNGSKEALTKRPNQALQTTPVTHSEI